jgi:hypothetical protein
MKLQSTKDKGNILRRARERRWIIFKGAINNLLQLKSKDDKILIAI